MGTSVTLALLICLTGRDGNLDLIGDHRISSHNPITVEDHMETRNGMFDKRGIAGYSEHRKRNINSVTMLVTTARVQIWVKSAFFDDSAQNVRGDRQFPGDSATFASDTLNGCVWTRAICERVPVP